MSNRLVKALRVLDLLHHRRAVSRETLVQEIGVTERTVYRILRTLSEAEIPVYYDQRRQGYTLNAMSRGVSLELALQELTVAVFALDLLSEVVGPAYQSAIVEARDRLIRCHPYDLDNVLCGRQLTPVANGMGGIDTSLNSALVSTAIEAGRSVEVDVDGEDGVVRSQSLAVPSLVYRSSEWFLVDKVTALSILLSAVRAVRITQEVPVIADGPSASLVTT